MRDVGFVGLGLMGSSMTMNLLAAGYPVHGFDVLPEARERHAQRGGAVVGSPAEAARRADLVVLSLPHGGIVAEACFGPGGIAESARPGLVVVDTTTSHPDQTVDNASRLATHGIGFLDASVSGTSAMAAERDLIAMVGGDHELYDEVGPVLDAFTRARYHLGPVGSGVRTKLVVNLVLGLTRVALAEGLVVGEKAGMDLPILLQVLKDSVASSKVMHVYGDRMVTGQHLPPTGRIRSHAKDVALIQEQAAQVGAPLHLVPVLAEIVEEAKRLGLSEWGSTATIEVLRERAGLGRATAARTTATD